MIFLKTMKYGCGTFFFGLCFALFTFATFGTLISKSPQNFWLVCALAAVLSLMLMWRVQKNYTRWLKDEGIYRSFRCFYVYLKRVETKHFIMDIGRFMLRRIGGIVVDIVFFVQAQKRKAAMREEYERLQDQRNSRQISAQEFCKAVDDMVETYKDR
jgi:hypothetical protein